MTLCATDPSHTRAGVTSVTSDITAGLSPSTCDDSAFHLSTFSHLDLCVRVGTNFPFHSPEK